MKNESEKLKYYKEYLTSLTNKRNENIKYLNSLLEESLTLNAEESKLKDIMLKFKKIDKTTLIYFALTLLLNVSFVSTGKNILNLSNLILIKTSLILLIPTLSCGFINKIKKDKVLKANNLTKRSFKEASTVLSNRQKKNKNETLRITKELKNIDKRLEQEDIKFETSCQDLKEEDLVISEDYTKKLTK